MAKLNRLIKFLKETDRVTLEKIMWEFRLKTGYTIELRGELLIFNNNPNIIVEEFSKFSPF